MNSHSFSSATLGLAALTCIPANTSNAMVSQELSKSFHHLCKAGAGAAHILSKNSSDFANHHPVYTGLAVAATAGALAGGTLYASKNETIKNMFRGAARWATGSSTANSLVSGMAVGAGTGLLAAELDRYGIWPVSWILTTSLRCSILNEISSDMTKSAIPHNQALMWSAADVADWGTYLMCPSGRELRKSILSKR